MWAILENIKAALEAVEGITTCKIGIESAINPCDYPLIRIVPTRDEKATTLCRKKVDVLVYYGMAQSEADAGSLEAVYESLCTLEDAVIAAMEGSTDFIATWQETVTDEDRLEAYKLFASRFTVVA